MKKCLLLAAAFMFAVSVFAQSDRYEHRYNLLVSKLGYDGVGVETILNAWEKEDSTNAAMLVGRFNYLFKKAQTYNIIAKDESRFLGMDPLISQKDSTGKAVYYYQETVYDDDIYGQAMKVADKLIGLYPERLDFRFLKANSYIAYEKESPDMAIADLLSLADESRSRKVWLYGEESVDASFFSDAMLEYCFSFYSIGTPASMAAFLALSERMTEIDPENTEFINNIGTYNLVVKEDYKTALKYYNKVLKVHPEDYTAIKNSVLIARKQKNLKLEKKYVRMLAEHGNENDKVAAKARLEQLEK